MTDHATTPEDFARCPRCGGWHTRRTVDEDACQWRAEPKETEK